MSNQNNLMAYFNDQSNFNDNEKHLINSLKKNSDNCQNIDINHLFPSNSLPIHYACLYNSTKFFMKQNLPLSQINIPGGSYDCTPMMFTIYNSNHKILLSLLLNGADILLRNKRSSDVLSFCVRYDDVFALILVLSFIEGNILINRYLRYSWIRNSEKTREFLIAKKSEIEGDGLIVNNNGDIFCFSSIKYPLIFFLIVLSSIYFKYIRLFALCLLLVFYSFSDLSFVPLIVNILYVIYAFYLILDSYILDYWIYIFFATHLICFLAACSMKTPYIEAKKIKEAKSLITNLVFEEKYNAENFCLNCLCCKYKLRGIYFKIF